MFENKDDRTVHKNYHLLTVEIKDYYVMIDGQNFFNQTVKNHLVTYNSIRNTATGQRDDYTTGCLRDYNHYEKMRAIDLSKQKALDADPKPIQQNIFAGNLDRGEDVNDNIIIFFIIEEAKETILDISQGTVKVLWMLWYDLARVAKFSDSKIFDLGCVFQNLFCLNIISK